MKVLDGLNLANQQITNLANGVAATDAVTLQQMQSYVNGLDWKASVRAASTANVTVASPGTTLDGVTLAVNDRVLLKNQTTGSENGIYVWTASGSALTRPADAAAGTLTSGTAVYVTEGTTLGDTAWTLTTNDPITVGTTSTTWAQFGGGPTYTAGNGISLAANTITAVAAASGGISVVAGGIQLDTTKAVTKYATSIGDGSTTTFTVTHNLNSQDVDVTIKDNGSQELVFMKVVAATVNTLTLVFPVAPTSNQYRVVVQV